MFNEEILTESVFGNIASSIAIFTTNKKWRDRLIDVKNTDPVKKSKFSFSKVKIENGYIGIYGINYIMLYNRITDYYKDKVIGNIFIKKYNVLSFKKFLDKKINKSNVKLDYIYAPEFFAIELANLFDALGTRYKDRSYKKIAVEIYEKSWLKKSDDKQVELVPTDRLSNLNLEITDYQKSFIQYYNILKAELNLNGYMLAFDQGLGKTFTVTALAECLEKERVYIVCPNTLKENWALELKKYYKKYSDDEKLWKREVYICESTRFDYNVNTTKFVITNNESIKKMYPYIKDGANSLLIIDESHNFRNYNSARVLDLLQLIEKLNCSDIIPISGTPIKATPAELVPMMKLLDPLFTDEAAKIYTKAFDISSTVGTAIIQARFGKLMYRRTKAEIGGLPEKFITNELLTVKDANKYLLSNIKALVIARFTEIYKEAYKNHKDYSKQFKEIIAKYSSAPDSDTRRYLKLIDDLTRIDISIELHEIDKIFVTSFTKLNVTPNIEDATVLEKLHFLETKYVQMKRSCMGIAIGEILPVYRTNMYIALYENNKDYIMNIINNSTKKTVIFSQFKKVVDYINDDLNKHDIISVKITGDVVNAKRLDVFTQFKEDDMTRVICATSQTMGTGVTLIEANQMFFFGTPWRSTDFDQCSDRIHRLGQTDDVYIRSILLDTGKELNLSSRMDSILQWSKSMFNSSIKVSEQNEQQEDQDIENILISESDMDISGDILLSESILIDKKDLYRNVDKFESGKSNVLLITGLSGSGKSTIASQYSHRHNADIICLDIMQFVIKELYIPNINTYSKSKIMNIIKGRGEIIYQFLYTTENGKDFLSKLTNVDYKFTPAEFGNITHEFVKYTIKYCLDDKDNNYILEGIQIYFYLSDEEIGDLPIIILGTSAMNSINRRLRRSSETIAGRIAILMKEFSYLVSWYWDDNRRLTTFNSKLALAESYDELADDILAESVILNDKDIRFNVERFESDKTNILLITGLSGSGKSTIATQFASKYNAEIIELDIFEHNASYSDDNLHQAGDIFVEYFFNNKSGKRFRTMSLNKEHLIGDEFHRELKSFINFLFAYCKRNNNKKYIVEGVQIYSHMNIDDIKNHSIIILGTSIKNSIIRRICRDDSNDYKINIREFPNMLKWYWNEEHTLKTLRKDITESENIGGYMDNILLCENEIFLTQDFNIAASAVLYEASELSTKLDMLEFTDNRVDVAFLLEDATQIKNNIIEAIKKMIEVIKRLTLKFQNMALSLVKTNEKWVESVSKMNKDAIAGDFTYSLYPYWKNMTILLNTQVPDFQENDEFYELLNAPESFTEKYFKQLYVSIDGKNVYNPKVAFQGKSSEKVSINKEELLPLIEGMVTFISTYNEKVKDVIKKNNHITEVLNKAVSMIKRAPVTESSNCIGNTIIKLLEADEPATTATIDDADKKKDGLAGDDKREEGGEKTQASDIKDISVERQAYAKICYGVNSAKMSAMEGAYNAYVKCLMAAKNSTKKEPAEKKEKVEKKEK